MVITSALLESTHGEVVDGHNIGALRKNSRRIVDGHNIGTLIKYSRRSS